MSRFLVTGATGQVGFPVALALAAEHDVVAVARFRDADARAQLDAAGVTCVEADLVRGSLDAVPSRCRLRLQFRGREVESVGCRHRGQCRSGRSADGPLPFGARVPALLVDRRLRGARRRTAARDRSAGRQPPGDDADLQHQQDRGGGSRAHDVPHARRPDHDRPAQRSVRRQRRLARVPPAIDHGGSAGPGAPASAEPLQPDPRGRHRRDDPGVARRRERCPRRS